MPRGRSRARCASPARAAHRRCRGRARSTAGRCGARASPPRASAAHGATTRARRSTQVHRVRAARAGSRGARARSAIARSRRRRARALVNRLVEIELRATLHARPRDLGTRSTKLVDEATRGACTIPSCARRPMRASTSPRTRRPSSTPARTRSPSGSPPSSPAETGLFGVHLSSVAERIAAGTRRQARARRRSADARSDSSIDAYADALFAIPEIGRDVAAGAHAVGLGRHPVDRRRCPEEHHARAERRRGAPRGAAHVRSRVWVQPARASELGVQDRDRSEAERLRARSCGRLVNAVRRDPAARGRGDARTRSAARSPTPTARWSTASPPSMPHDWARADRALRRRAGAPPRGVRHLALRRPRVLHRAAREARHRRPRGRCGLLRAAWRSTSPPTSAYALRQLRAAAVELRREMA